MAMSTKQKWAIGCSGCLVVIVGAFVLMGILGKMGLDKLSEVNQQASSEIFGSEMPAGYMTLLGIPIDDKSGKSHMMITMTPGQNMLIAFEGPAEHKDLKHLSLTNEEELKEVAEEFLKKAAAKSNKVEAKETKIEDVMISTLSNGKRMPIVDIKVKNKKGVYIPVSVAIVPTPDNHMVALMDMSITSQSTEADTSFASTYQGLGLELSSLVEDTNLDDKMLSFEQ